MWGGQGRAGLKGLVEISSFPFAILDRRHAAGYSSGADCAQAVGVITCGVGWRLLHYSSETLNTFQVGKSHLALVTRHAQRLARAWSGCTDVAPGTVVRTLRERCVRRVPLTPYPLSFPACSPTVYPSQRDPSVETERQT